MKYVHQSTTLGTVSVKRNGLTVQCTVTIIRMGGRVVTTHDIEFEMYNMTADHEAGMKPLIDAAYAKGKSLAAAYISAREAEVAA
jgi:hypothetical protein